MQPSQDSIKSTDAASSVSSNAYIAKETTKAAFVRTADNAKILNDQYIIGKRIAEGSLSVIRLIKDKNQDKLYAMKKYNKTILQKKKELLRGKDGKTEYRDSYSDILNEIHIMKRLDHPNVIKLIESVNDPQYHKLFLIIDFCEKGSIIDWSQDDMEFRSKRKEKYLPEEEIARILKQVITGLEYLHSNKIIHRDLKPQNLLQMQDGTIKIADFDIAADMTKDDVVLNKTKGTLHFMAPELCKKNASLSDSVIGYTADLWSLGVTLYSMTYLRLPFFEKSLMDLITAIETKPHFHIVSRGASEELKELIDSMLEKDPKKRITLKEIKEHKFLQKYAQSATDKS